MIYWGAGGGDATADAVARLSKLGLTVTPWAEALEKGAAAPAEAVPPTADDFCTIMCEFGHVPTRRTYYVCSVRGSAPNTAGRGAGRTG